MNHWEETAILCEDASKTGHNRSADVVQFHPKIYTGSGFDAVSILLEIYNRPNPQVSIGPVDASCPIIICDLTQHDVPIIYASPAFTRLTGYSVAEALGRNCRFLQTPPNARPSSRKPTADKHAVEKIRHAVRHRRECQVTITNYRKDGTKFLNYLTIIPVRWQSSEYNYSIGLQNVAP